MKSQPILLAKDPASGDDGCPSVHLADGAFTVLGIEVTTENLDVAVLPGERAVSIDIDTVRSALARYDAGEFS